MRAVIVHPGAMGASVGAALASRATPVAWAGEGRSAATRARAEAAGLEDRGTLARALEGAGLVLSVCPPHAALDVAVAVAGCGFAGIYVDANAVSPEVAEAVGRAVEAAGADFVDGGIIGPPVREAGTTRLYLSGDRAAEVARLFAGSPLEARVVAGGAGAASSLKMAYAAWTKGGDALLLAIRALARARGVEAALLEEWALSRPGVAERSSSAASRNAFKAWRFEGEMREIADTFAGTGLPDGFHRAAGEIYRRLAGFKDREPAPSLDEVLEALLRGGG